MIKYFTYMNKELKKLSDIFKYIVLFKSSRARNKNKVKENKIEKPPFYLQTGVSRQIKTDFKTNFSLS